MMIVIFRRRLSEFWRIELRSDSVMFVVMWIRFNVTMELASTAHQISSSYHLGSLSNNHFRRDDVVRTCPRNVTKSQNEFLYRCRTHDGTVNESESTFCYQYMFLFGNKISCLSLDRALSPTMFIQWSGNHLIRCVEFSCIIYPYISISTVKFAYVNVLL